MTKALMLISNQKTFMCGFLGPVRNLYSKITKLNGISNMPVYMLHTNNSDLQEVKTYFSVLYLHVAFT